MQSHYDIFISYKRKSLPTANNLYYRLTTRGYSTFFDLEEMGRDNFNIQLLNYIENAKDVFVILEEGSLDACKSEDWEKDWFCHEIAFALEKKKNIIPILLNGYKMPSEDFFPDKLKEFHLKQAPEFNFSFFEAYLDKLVEKEYLLSKPNLQDKVTSVFKFYSNENCQVYKEGKLVCSLEGMSDEPYYLPVPRKGDYRFKVVNTITSNHKIIKERVDVDEEKEIEIDWGKQESFQFDPKADFFGNRVSPKIEIFNVLGVEFRMIRVKKGSFYMGTVIPKTHFTQVMTTDFPRSHSVVLTNDYLIGEAPVTQELWRVVMHDNPSRFIEDYSPVDSVSWLDCQTFITCLNSIMGMKFRLPTEAEWEFAARGGIMSQHLLYSGSNDIEEVAWCLDNSSDQTHPIKQKKPNELGLYDMSGNVWEWCQDFYAVFQDGIQRDPMGPIKGTHRVYRGGCWCEMEDCRVTMRRAGLPDFTSYGGLGLRLALTI